MPPTNTIPITIYLPHAVVDKIESEAEGQKRTVTDVVEEIILSRWSTLPRLPETIETELAAFYNLADDLLWFIARKSLNEADQQELAELNKLAKEKDLNDAENKRLDELIQLYDQTMIRRAQAVAVLQSRGYDLSDPEVL